MFFFSQKNRNRSRSADAVPSLPPDLQQKWLGATALLRHAGCGLAPMRYGAGRQWNAALVISDLLGPVGWLG